ncbi:hypothetical protein PI124_g16895 [Phytophthora idaei]|nr:hypothetical protein PI125_g16680 [Phytophthora idaei]KAG3140051.1 hypothetical protein PI126_g16197 [Phytophthora idaei]KAG3238131.1 hypothetical protein PI124_g16895 [Phytophthora idaei]
MRDTYGSEDPDSKKTDHVRPWRSQWTKIALATTGAALFIGGALILYASWQPASSVATVNVSPLVMTLENARSTDESALLSGQEVLLRVSVKPNLCADDGGSLKPDESAFTGQPCNLSNLNQLFIYNRPVP